MALRSRQARHDRRCGISGQRTRLYGIEQHESRYQRARSSAFRRRSARSGTTPLPPRHEMWRAVPRTWPRRVRQCFTWIYQT